MTEIAFEERLSDLMKGISIVVAICVNPTPAIPKILTDFGSEKKDVRVSEFNGLKEMSSFFKLTKTSELEGSTDNLLCEISSSSRLEYCLRREAEGNDVKLFSERLSCTNEKTCRLLNSSTGKFVNSLFDKSSDSREIPRKAVSPMVVI